MTEPDEQELQRADAFVSRHSGPRRSMRRPTAWDELKSDFASAMAEAREEGRRGEARATEHAFVRITTTGHGGTELRVVCVCGGRWGGSPTPEGALLDFIRHAGLYIDHEVLLLAMQGEYESLIALTDALKKARTEPAP